MNKYLYIMVMGLLLWSCDDNKTYDFFASKNYLNADNVVSIGGEKDDFTTFKVEADCEWRIEEVPSWLDVSPLSGRGNTEITLKCNSANTANTERKVEIKIVDPQGKIRQTINVVQSKSAGNGMFRSPIEVECMEQTLLEPLKCNGKWKLEYSQTSDKWLEVYPTEGDGDAMITLKFKSNRAKTAREGKITFTLADGTWFDVPVRQKEYEFYFDVTFPAWVKVDTLENNNFEIKCGKECFGFTMTVRSSDQWKFGTLHVEGGAYWYGITQDIAGSEHEDGRYLIDFAILGMNEYSPQERSISFTVVSKNAEYSDAERNIKIKQVYEEETPEPNTEIKLSEYTIFAPYNGGEYRIEVNCDKSWVVQSNVGWIKVNKSGNNELTVQVDEYDAQIPRNRAGSVVVATADGTVTVNLSILQQYAPSNIRLSSIEVENVNKHTVKILWDCYSRYSLVGADLRIIDPEIYENDGVVFTTNKREVEVSNLKSHHTYFVEFYALDIIGGSAYGRLEFTTLGDIPGEENQPPTIQ